MHINFMACLFLIVKGTSRKIDPRISQIEFDEVVGKLLKHAPSKQGGYRFKVRAQFKLFMALMSLISLLSLFAFLIVMFINFLFLKDIRVDEISSNY